MPTYGYECNKCNEQFEVFQKITEDSLKIHDNCGGDLKKLIYPVGIAFKGSGFYVNDYAAKKPAVKEKSDPKSDTALPATTSESKTETATPATPAPSAAPAPAPVTTTTLPAK